MKNKKLQALIGAIKNIYTIIQSKLRLLTCWQQAVGKTDCTDDVCCDCKKENISCFDKKLNNMTGESNGVKEVRKFIDRITGVLNKQDEKNLGTFLINNGIDCFNPPLLFYNFRNEKIYIHFDKSFFYIIYYKNNEFILKKRSDLSEFEFNIIDDFGKYYLSIKGLKSMLPISKEIFGNNIIPFMENTINKLKNV